MRTRLPAEYVRTWSTPRRDHVNSPAVHAFMPEALWTGSPLRRLQELAAALRGRLSARSRVTKEANRADCLSECNQARIAEVGPRRTCLNERVHRGIRHGVGLDCGLAGSIRMFAIFRRTLAGAATDGCSRRDVTC
jgi:hypothetical protein